MVLYGDYKYELQLWNYKSEFLQLQYKYDGHQSQGGWLIELSFIPMLKLLCMHWLTLFWDINLLSRIYHLSEEFNA